MFKRFVVGMALAATLGGCSCGLAGCSNSDAARRQMMHEAEDNYGVMRTVTAYSSTGEQIGQWHGKIDVSYADGSGSEVSSSSPMSRVDVVVFDGDEPVDRIIISGAIVVVDND